MWCNHKWGTISEDRYQYCQKCNKAKYVPKQCEHNWETIKEYKQIINTQTAYGKHEDINPVFICRCKKCGEFERFEV